MCVCVPVVHFKLNDSLTQHAAASTLMAGRVLISGTNPHCKYNFNEMFESLIHLCFHICEMQTHSLSLSPPKSNPAKLIECEKGFACF